MLLVILSLALVALVAWFFKACIHRGSDEPPRAWLSSTPPLIEYGKDPVAFLRRARAKYGDVFTIPGPLPMTFIFETTAVRAYFDSPESDLSFLHGVMKIVGHLFGPDLLAAGGLRDTLNGIILKGLHQVRSLTFLYAKVDRPVMVSFSRVLRPLR